LIHDTVSRRPVVAVDTRAATNVIVDDAFSLEVEVPVTKRAMRSRSAMEDAHRETV
jgi:hypothetical protein